MEAWALGLAGSPLVLLLMYLFATVDGFFPPIPSESLVIALASLSVTPGGSPALLPVLLVAAVGAFTGDQIAYTIGGRVDVRHLRIFRGRRAQAALDWAQRALTERGASFIIAGRYIPVGRVAVNMTAGALRFSRRTFVALDALASITWACYGAAIGVGAGRVLQGRPLLAIGAGVVGGMVIGLLVDTVLGWWGRGPRPATGPAGGGEAPLPDDAEVTRRSRRGRLR